MNFLGVLSGALFTKKGRIIILGSLAFIFIVALSTFSALFYRAGKRAGDSGGYARGFGDGVAAGRAEVVREQLVDQARTGLDSWSWFNLDSK